MFKRIFFCILLPGSLLLMPFLLRPAEEKVQVSADADADRLVIISAHNKGIRDEYDRAFKKYYREKFGRDALFAQCRYNLQ